MSAFRVESMARGQCVVPDDTRPALLRRPHAPITGVCRPALVACESTDRTADVVESDEIDDVQPSSQPMSLATAMFYVEYTGSAFRVMHRGSDFYLTSCRPTTHGRDSVTAASAAGPTYPRKVDLIEVRT